MSEFMDRPRFAPADGNTNGHEGEVSEKGHGVGPREFEDSPSGLAQDGGNSAGAATESRGPAPSPEANPRAVGVSPKNDYNVIRDRLGRFQVDNPGGPGNPFGRHVA